jgi:hypothetical protein
MNLLHEIGSHLTGLEQLKVMMTNDLRPGIGETLDIRLIEVEEGGVVLEATRPAPLQSHRHGVWWLCRDHAGFRLWVCRALQAHARNALLDARTEGGISQGHHQGHQPHSRRGYHRDDGTAGGVHGRSTGGCAWLSVRLGHVEPFGDATNLEAAVLARQGGVIPCPNNLTRRRYPTEEPNPSGSPCPSLYLPICTSA